MLSVSFNYHQAVGKALVEKFLLSKVDKEGLFKSLKIKMRYLRDEHLLQN